jgi:hypothetical protein
VLNNPLARDDVGARWSSDKIPGVVAEHGTIFLFHSSMPMWICQG